MKPIDLQVNFSQMNHVSKDQASIKNSELNQQIVKGSELAKENMEADTKVSAIKSEEDVLSKIRDQEKRDQNSDQSKDPEKNQVADNLENRSKNKAKLKKDSLFNDLASGWHIDITG